MKRAFTTSSVVLIALLFLFAACRSSRGDLSKAETQRRFGVRMAKMNLWREAMFRFQRATQIEPANAMSHNNLAVAYEANGDFDAAAKEYREAMRLDRSNEYIQKNYSRFVEFTQKSKKREAKPAATTTDAAAAPAAPAASTSTAATATAPVAAPATDTAAPAPATSSAPATNTTPPATPPTTTDGTTTATDTTATNPPQGGVR